METGGRTVVADFEAGLGTLSRIPPGGLDIALVVAEPTVKSMEVARRALAMIAEKGLGRALLVANRLAGEADLARVLSVLGHEPEAALPDDPAVRAADLEGRSPFDTAPQAPAVRAARSLAESL